MRMFLYPHVHSFIFHSLFPVEGCSLAVTQFNKLFSQRTLGFVHHLKCAYATARILHSDRIFSNACFSTCIRKYSKTKIEFVLISQQLHLFYKFRINRSFTFTMISHIQLFNCCYSAWSGVMCIRNYPSCVWILMSIENISFSIPSIDIKTQ